MNQSQKCPKDSETCSVCWSVFKLQRRIGTLHKHGHRDNPCSESGTATASSTLPSSQNSSPMLSTTSSVSQLDAYSSGTKLTLQILDAGNISSHCTEKKLSHSFWTRLINRIPRATHTSCMLLLIQLIEALTKAPNDKSAQLWSAVPTKPTRGGANRNLSNIMNKKVSKTKTILYQVQPFQVKGKIKAIMKTIY